MLHPPVTISIAFVHGMLSGVRARGESIDAFLADAGIDPKLLEQVGARVTADQYVALFQSLTDRLDDDLLGFLTRPLRRGSFALVVRSAASEDNLESAMRRTARTFGLLQSDVALELVQSGIACRGGAALQRSVGCARGLPARVAAALALASVRVAGGRQAARRAIRLRVPESALRRRLREDLSRAAAIRTAAFGALDRRRSAAATGAPRQSRGAGVPLRRAVERHRAAARAIW